MAHSNERKGKTFRWRNKYSRIKWDGKKKKKIVVCEHLGWIVKLLIRHNYIQEESEKGAHTMSFDHCRFATAEGWKE